MCVVKYYVAYFGGRYYNMNYSPYNNVMTSWADRDKHITLVKKLYGNDARAFADWLPNASESFFLVPNEPGNWSVE